MVALANHWCRKGYQVSLPVLTKETVSFFPLDNEVSVHPLGASAASREGLGKIVATTYGVHRLRRWLKDERPDVLIAFIDQPNMIACMASRGLGIRLIISERADPERGALLSIHWPLGSRALVRRLRNALYRQADLLVVQTEWLSSEFDVRAREGNRVIPNVAECPANVEAGFLPKKPFILSVGRLAAQKRHDLVIDAFARVAANHPELSLVILGEGCLRPSLEAQAAAVGLGERVLLPGAVRNAAALMSDAEIFVLASDFEGFPNALVEAMAVGTPCIATNCRYGPNEIVIHGSNGWLVEPGSVDDLTLALQQLLAAPDLRARLALNGTNIVERLSPTRIYGLWDACLQAGLSCDKEVAGEE